MKTAWDPQHEKMARKELERLQLRRLQDKVSHLFETVPFYRKSMRERGVTTDSIRSLADLVKLPFTTRQDLRDNYPYGLVATPHDKIVRMQASSGTTGKPILSLYTSADVKLWTEMMARTLTSGGATGGDVVQIAFAYGLFTGGLGFHYGSELIGAAVIPASSGHAKRQVLLMQDLGSTVLCCTPSYALILAETALEMGVDLSESRLRVGFFGAEPWSEQMRREIEAKLGIVALDTYGLTEVIGPGVAAECLHKSGMHIYEDHFLPEVIDPQTGEPLPPGQAGELVFTTLTKQALPLLRYRTGDITSLNLEPCPCGRTIIRMEKVTGRTDDMLTVGGVNLFPSQIESILLRFEGVDPHYQVIVDREGTIDNLEVRVEISKAVFSELLGETRRLQSIERAIRVEIESLLGVTARVRLIEPGSLERSEHKAKRVIDRRQM